MDRPENETEWGVGGSMGHERIWGPAPEMQLGWGQEMQLGWPEPPPLEGGHPIGNATENETSLTSAPIELH